MTVGVSPSFSDYLTVDNLRDERTPPESFTSGVSSKTLDELMQLVNFGAPLLVFAESDTLQRQSLTDRVRDEASAAGWQITEIQGTQSAPAAVALAELLVTQEGLASASASQESECSVSLISDWRLIIVEDAHCLNDENLNRIVRAFTGCWSLQKAEVGDEWRVDRPGLKLLLLGDLHRRRDLITTAAAALPWNWLENYVAVDVSESRLLDDYKSPKRRPLIRAEGRSEPAGELADVSEFLSCYWDAVCESAGSIPWRKVLNRNSALGASLLTIAGLVAVLVVQQLYDSDAAGQISDVPVLSAVNSNSEVGEPFWTEDRPDQPLLEEISTKALPEEHMLADLEQYLPRTAEENSALSASVGASDVEMLEQKLLEEQLQAEKTRVITENASDINGIDDAASASRDTDNIAGTEQGFDAVGKPSQAMASEPERRESSPASVSDESVEKPSSESRSTEVLLPASANPAKLAPAATGSKPLAEAKRTTAEVQDSIISPAELHEIPAGSYFIQILAGRYQGDAEEFRVAQDNRDKLRILDLSKQDRSWFLVLAGPFDGFSEARQKMADLPDSQRGMKPWLRLAENLQKQVKKPQADTAGRGDSE